MSPYKIEMYVNSYTEEDKEPLYNLIIYTKYNDVMEMLKDVSKEYCIKYLAAYCGISI